LVYYAHITNTVRYQSHRAFLVYLFDDVSFHCSLSRLLSPLEAVINNELTKKEPTLYQWYSSYQNPLVVRTFVNIFENDPQFNSATAMYVLYILLDHSMLMTNNKILPPFF
jgi:hypothetical protein